MELLRARIREESGPGHVHGTFRVPGRIEDCETCYPDLPRVMNTYQGHTYSRFGRSEVHQGSFKLCDDPRCEDLFARLRADPNIVDCDRECQARTDPQGLAELEAAVEHWSEHPNMGGCSHGG